MNYTQHISTGVKNVKGREILVAIQNMKEGTVVAVKPLLTSLGLSWGPQSSKIKTNPQFNCSVKRIVAKDGKSRDMLCIPTEQVPYLFTTICASRVKADKKESVIALQKFFSESLNSVVRGDYVTKDMVNDIVKQAIAPYRKELDLVIQENRSLREKEKFNQAASKKRASAASMGMLARKDELRAENVFPLFSKAN